LNAQTSTGTFLLAPKANIGQGAHYLTYCYSGPTTNLKIWLEESFDGSTNWVPFSSVGTLTGTFNGNCNELQGGGYFNHIRVNLNQLAGTGASVSAWYSASAAPIPLFQIAQGTQGAFVPTGCDTPTFALIASASSGTLKGGALNSAVHICNVVITFAGTPTATGQINIYQNAVGNGCATVSGFIQEFFTGSANPISYGSGFGATINGSLGSDICIQNTGTGVSALVSFSYAFY